MRRAFSLVAWTGIPARWNNDCPGRQMGSKAKRAAARYGVRRGKPAGSVQRGSVNPIRVDESQKSDAAECDGVTVMGELFTIQVEAGQGGNVIHLVHPRWSVMGSGRTLEEAENDLRAEAREVGEILANRDPAGFTPSGREMRDFVLKFLGTST